MTSQNHYVFLMFFFRSTKNKSHKKIKKKHEKTHLFKNIIKTNEISTFPSLRSVPRTTPDDQNHPRAPPGPPQTPSENFTCFRSLPGPPQGPPGASRGPPQGPPETPQGRPATPRGTPNAPQGPPQRPPGTPRGRPGPPEGIPQSQRTAQGPTPRFGPAECAERLNKLHIVYDIE